MILTYHEIVDQPSRYVYDTALPRMQEQIAYLRRRTEAGLPPVPVTFDDGLASHRNVAAEVLENAGFRGTFFVSPRWTGAAGFMKIADLKQLVAAGHEVQSHGWSHAFLPQCGPEELRNELGQSKKVLEDWLGREVDALAVPGGAYNATVLRVAAETGYRRVYVSEPWLAPTVRAGVLVSGRLMLRRSTSVEKLQQLLATEGRLLSWQRLAYMVRSAARVLVGTSLYHYLWRLMMRAERTQPDSNTSGGMRRKAGPRTAPR